MMDEGQALLREESIKDGLLKKFAFLEEKIFVKRARRLDCAVMHEDFSKVFEYLTKDAGFVVLCAMTGLDEGEFLSVIYHIAREDGTILNLKASVAKASPIIESISDNFPAADVYERELVDLFGFKVYGLKEGKRYPLPDDWPADDHPLRKDWKPKDKVTL